MSHSLYSLWSLSHVHEWIMPHLRMSHVTYMIIYVHDPFIYEPFPSVPSKSLSHTWTRHVTVTWTRNVTVINKSFRLTHNHVRDMTHSYMSRSRHSLRNCCHIHEWDTSHVWMSYVVPLIFIYRQIWNSGHTYSNYILVLNSWIYECHFYRASTIKLLAHTWIRHIHEWDTYMNATHTWMRHIHECDTYMIDSHWYHFYSLRVMYISRRIMHVTCLFHICAVSFIFFRPSVTYVNETCHIHEWVMTCPICHVTCMILHEVCVTHSGVLQ